MISIIFDRDCCDRQEISPCQIFVIEKLSVGTILQCHTLVIQYVIMKKKKKKQKENPQGSEQNVVGVKEIAQG